MVSFNHGSRNHAQLKQVYRTAMIFTVAASVTVFLFAQFAGDTVVTVFARRGTMSGSWPATDSRSLPWAFCSPG